MKNNLSNMMSLDIFISSISDSECENIMSEITPLKESIMPLASWDIFSQDYNLTLENLKNESDIDFIKLFAKKAHWKNEIDGIFNPNGSSNNIAGILNPKKNILGMMPHPERAFESYHCSTDGFKILDDFMGARSVVPAARPHT